MKRIVMYKCDICNEYYLTEKEALECEARGREIPLVEIGTEVTYEVKIGGFDSVYIPFRIGNILDKGHYIYYELLEEHDGCWVESKSCCGNKELLKKCII